MEVAWEWEWVQVDNHKEDQDQCKELLAKEVAWVEECHQEEDL
jgi:hypothetical protein